MESKGQSGWDYLLLIGGAILVAVIVIAIFVGFQNAQSEQINEPRFSCQGLLLEDCAARYLTDYNIIYQVSPRVCVEWEEVDCPSDRPFEYARNKDSVLCQKNSESDLGLVVDFNCTEQVYIDELIENWQEKEQDLNLENVIWDCNSSNCSNENNWFGAGELTIGVKTDCRPAGDGCNTCCGNICTLMYCGQKQEKASP